MPSPSNSPQQLPQTWRPPRPPTAFRRRRGALANIFSIIHENNDDHDTTAAERAAHINNALQPATPVADASCPICLNTFSPRSPSAITLPCNHVFRRNCIKQWLRTHNTCPLCRRQLFHEPAPAIVESAAPHGRRASDTALSGFEDALEAVLRLYTPSALLRPGAELARVEPLSPASLVALDDEWTEHEARHAVTVDAAAMLALSVTARFLGVRNKAEEGRRDELNAALFGLFREVERLDGRDVAVRVVFEGLVAAGMGEMGLLRRRRRRMGFSGMMGRV